MKRFLWLLVAIAFIGPATQNSTVQAQRLHAFVVVDSDDSKIGESVSFDGFQITDMLENGLPDNKYVVYGLAGQEVTSENIIRTIRNAKIAPMDSVLFYYSGHGAFDRGDGEHYFTLNYSDPLSRSQVRQELQRHRPGLTVMITDCCAGLIRVPIPTRSATASGSGLKAQQETYPILEELFFNTHGVVDITSSRPGQLSIGLDSGGLFTTAIVNVVEGFTDTRLDWQALFSKARARTSEAFEFVEELHQSRFGKGIGDRQKTQTAWSFDTMYGVDPNNQRLGIHIDLNRPGVITQVGYGSIAEQHGLEPGDAILSVNGQTFQSSGEAIECINNSSRNLDLVVRCIRTGNHYKIPLKLPY